MIHHMTLSGYVTITFSIYDSRRCYRQRNDVQFGILWELPVFYDEIQNMVTNILNLYSGKVRGRHNHVRKLPRGHRRSSAGADGQHG
jgi:hypothetical protein